MVIKAYSSAFPFGTNYSAVFIMMKNYMT